MQMFLINSANFDLLDINLSKNLFFLGDNASGKTTTTRAIHYLYCVDSKALGIPRDKDNFEKHYFPHSNSYIIYTFREFFILMYKRSGGVQKWFSKQKFNLNRLFENGELIEHSKILKYIKEVSSYHSQSSEEYRKIIYGQDRRYLDFSIASIKNYDAFLEVYNMVFNVDKAIVDMKSIKKAIQKSLQRDDKALSFDFEEYIANMQEFKRDYYFFKKFDKQRDNIKKANLMLERLIFLEDKSAFLLGKIKFNFRDTKEKLPLIQEDIQKEKNKIKLLESRLKHWSKRLENSQNRCQKIINDYIIKIGELENLKNRYSFEEYQKALTLSSKKRRLETQRDELFAEIIKLETKHSSIIKSIDYQIEALIRESKDIIPHEKEQKFRKLKESEIFKYDEIVESIKNKFEGKIYQREQEIKVFKGKIENIDKEIEKLRDIYENSLDDISKEYEDLKIEIEKEKEVIEKELNDKSIKIKHLNYKKRLKEEKIIKLKENYKRDRSQRAEDLNRKRVSINQEIDRLNSLLYHKPNTFKAFLAEEFEGWEERIYPIIDKNLLSLSLNMLNPTINEASSSIFFGIKIDTTHLEKYPTRDMLSQKILQIKKDKRLALEKMREIDIEKKDELKKEIEDINLKIENIKGDIQYEDNLRDKLKERYNSLEEERSKAKSNYELKKINLKEEVKTRKEEYQYKIQRLQTKVKELSSKIKNYEKSQKLEINKSKEKLESNIKTIKDEIKKELEQELISIQEKINSLEREKFIQTEDERLLNLKNEKEIIDKEITISTEAEIFLKEYQQKREEIERLPKVKDKFKEAQRFKGKIEKMIKDKILVSKKSLEYSNKNLQKINERLKRDKNSLKRVENMKLDFDKIEEIEERDDLGAILDNYISIKRDYENSKIDFKRVVDKLSSLENSGVIDDINLNMDRFDEVESVRELENIRTSLKELEKFNEISYKHQKKSKHTKLKNYIDNIIYQKMGNLDDLEDNFKEQLNRVNRNLKEASFGAIQDISLSIGHLKVDKNSIASLMRKLRDKLISAKVMFEDKNSLFFDEPKSVKSIDDIIEILEEVKKLSNKGTLYLFDTIDLSISYVENGIKYQNRTHLKNDSSSGGNILLKVAVAISILALFTKKVGGNKPFFLIIDEVSRLQRQNQEKLKKYINTNAFKSLFITPDPIFPDPQSAVYYMFRGGNRDGKLEIVQMNII